MAQALEEKVIAAEDRFTFHDLRSYYVTMHKQAHGTLPDLHKTERPRPGSMTEHRLSSAMRCDENIPTVGIKSKKR
ncbi:hypothetical protein [Xylophilus sp.]|uniref:hypothetical protein n=1 Tax=Xylophilus sp. TaxID=2653893 RepID=UPI0013BA4223|nr:hypothetical protein [Xylophilus sp.]KAF1046496.1 MAG: hypothetical protein GAK38_02401 [Xylophilus sp.]